MREEVQVSIDLWTTIISVGNRNIFVGNRNIFVRSRNIFVGNIDIFVGNRNSGMQFYTQKKLILN
jgi:hypothetical protein